MGARAVVWGYPHSNPLPFRVSEANTTFLQSIPLLFPSIASSAEPAAVLQPQTNFTSFTFKLLFVPRMSDSLVDSIFNMLFNSWLMFFSLSLSFATELQGAPVEINELSPLPDTHC